MHRVLGVRGCTAVRWLVNPNPGRNSRNCKKPYNLLKSLMMRLRCRSLRWQKPAGLASDVCPVVGQIMAIFPSFFGPSLSDFRTNQHLPLPTKRYLFREPTLRGLSGGSSIPEMSSQLSSLSSRQDAVNNYPYILHQEGKIRRGKVL
jgi:hypothetical protein